MIKFKLPAVQQSMQLYLANRETECILFRPIKNNIVAAFAQLQQLLSQHYSGDELLLIACPLPEQVSVMLSSSALAQAKDQQQQLPTPAGLPEAKDQVMSGNVQQTRQQRLSSVEAQQELVAKQHGVRVEGHKAPGGIENV